MRNWLRRWTIDQWEAIDREHREPDLPVHHGALVLVTATISLVVPRFFGRANALSEMPFASEWMAGLPHPDLYPHLYWAAFKALNYGLLPLLCIAFVSKRPLGDFGLRFVREPKVWALYGAMLLLVLPMAYVASFSDAFLSTYPKYRAAGDSWPQLLAWEAAYGFQFFMLEFFFRGFLIFALARQIGSMAIFVMVLPYAMIHLGKPMAECFGSIVTGIALGTVALRTRSIYGGVVVHCGVAWGMDLFALAQTGALRRLLGG